MKQYIRYLISVIIGIIIAFTTKIPVLYKFALIIVVVLICQILIDYLYNIYKKDDKKDN